MKFDFRDKLQPDFDLLTLSLLWDPVGYKQAIFTPEQFERLWELILEHTGETKERGEPKFYRGAKIVVKEEEDT